MKALYQVVSRPLTDFQRLIDGVWVIESLPVGGYVYDADMQTPNRNVAGFAYMLERGRIVDVSAQGIEVPNGDYSKVGKVELVNKAQPKVDTKAKAESTEGQG